MAINPSTRFPTKVLAPSSPWPLGEPKDIVTPGDSTGTPWEVGVVKDVMGLQQALLLSAGITATNIPETALASQYLDALRVLFATELDATTDILTTDLPSTPGVRTLGYATTQDGGGAIWVATGVTTPGSAGTDDFANGFIYDNSGIQFEIVPGTINPRQFGAIGDGVANDTVAIQDTLTILGARGGGELYFSRGTYFCNAQLTLKDKVSLRGDGPGVSIITFAGAVGSFPSSACIRGAGTFTALPNINVDIAPGDEEVSFASAHAMSADDLFLVTDPRNQSYGAGGNNARAGEFFVVARVINSTEIAIETPAYATTNPAVNLATTTYDLAQVDMNVVTPIRVAIRELEVIGVSSTSGLELFNIEWGRGVVFQNVKLSECENALVELRLCYDTRLTDVVMSNSDSTGIKNRGVACLHVQRLYLTRVQGGGANNMLFVSEGLSSPTVVNREIVVRNCKATQHGQAEGSLQLTRNTEYLKVSDSMLAGIRTGGDHIEISNCSIEGQVAPSPGSLGEGWAINLANMTGFDVRVSGCRIWARENVAAGAALIFMNDSTSIMDRPNTAVFSDCVIDMRGFTGDIVRITATRISADFPGIRFAGCRVVGSNISTDGFEIKAVTNAGWSKVDFDGCVFEKGGMEVQGAEEAQFSDCKVDRPPAVGILVANPFTNPFTVRRVTISGCYVFEAFDAGIEIQDNDSVVFCFGTTSLNSNRNSSKSADRSAFAFEPNSGAGTTALTLQGNTFGDDQAVLTQIFAYHYDDVDNVIDSDTLIVGNLTVSRTASILDVLGNVYDSNADNTEFTGTMGLQGGDTSAAPATADDFVIGTGTGSRGIYLFSSATGDSSIIMGDPSDDDRFTIVGDHANDALVFTVAGIPMASFEPEGILPAVTLTDALGQHAFRWEAIYGGTMFCSRLFMDNGTATTTGDFNLVGWGAGGGGSSINASLTVGRDATLRCVIDNGTGAGANPTVQYTMPDGASGTTLPIAQVTNRGGIIAQWDVSATTATVVTVRFNGTPTDSVQYGFNLTLTWPDD